jgi:hypothetical protein
MTDERGPSAFGRVLRLLCRILITLVVTVTVVFVVMNWIVPVALSFDAVRTAPSVASVVPADLKDQSVSQAQGRKLSYLGYEFEVPWTDLDEPQTKLYPKDKPDKNRVDLRFRSGLRLLVTTVLPREWATELHKDFKVPPQAIESAFGPETMKSDYDFVKSVYEFTPGTLHHWTTSSRVRYREQMLLIIKSIVPSKWAETGIFNLRARNFQGFQQGNPQTRQEGYILSLYSDEGSVEFIVGQKDYKNSAGVTQAEINRIVQSLRRVR